MDARTHCHQALSSPTSKAGNLRVGSSHLFDEQKAASNNPRSTVGTVTEVHDYLRVLFASIGVQYCHNCGRKVGKKPRSLQASLVAAETLLKFGEFTGVNKD